MPFVRPNSVAVCRPACGMMTDHQFGNWKCMTHIDALHSAARASGSSHRRPANTNAAAARKDTRHR